MSADVLDRLYELFLEKGENKIKEKILEYDQGYNYSAPYSSVDIRNAGFKISPVDINLFPAGFNNFSQDTVNNFIPLIKEFINDKSIAKILIIAENHTRNIKYLMNVCALADAFKLSGVEVRISSTDITQDTIIELENGMELSLHTMCKSGNIISLEDDFIPDAILLNNDMVTGVPDILSGVSQLLVPNTNLGWYYRKKYDSLRYYNEICTNVLTQMGMDPWLMSSYIDTCSDLNFKNMSGVEQLAEKVEKVIDNIRKKYQEYDIDKEPYVFIKANNGTYGMGIMTAKSADDVLNLNKNKRKKMHKVKSQTMVSEVVIQEGIPTANVYNDCSAELILYSLFGTYCGTLLRFHEQVDNCGSLNIPNTQFVDISNDIDLKEKCIYSIISYIIKASISMECADISIDQ